MYPFLSMGECHSDVGAGSARGQPFLNRCTRSGLLMKGGPKAIRSACPSAIAVAVTTLRKRVPITGRKEGRRLNQAARAKNTRMSFNKSCDKLAEGLASKDSRGDCRLLEPLVPEFLDVMLHPDP